VRQVHRDGGLVPEPAPTDVAHVQIKAVPVEPYLLFSPLHVRLVERVQRLEDEAGAPGVGVVEEKRRVLLPPGTKFEHRVDARKALPGAQAQQEMGQPHAVA